MPPNSSSGWSMYSSGNNVTADQNATLEMRTGKSPVYPPEIWNVHQRTLDGLDHTNNLSNGWNNGYLSLVGGKHPNIWKFINALKLDEGKVHTKVLKDKVGCVPQLIQQKKEEYIELNICLMNLWVVEQWILWQHCTNWAINWQIYEQN